MKSINIFYHVSPQEDKLSSNIPVPIRQHETNADPIAAFIVIEQTFSIAIVILQIDAAFIAEFITER